MKNLTIVFAILILAYTLGCIFALLQIENQDIAIQTTIMIMGFMIAVSMFFFKKEIQKLGY